MATRCSCRRARCPTRWGRARPACWQFRKSSSWLRNLVLILALLAAPAVAAERTLADFFREFTDQWMRGDPNRAASTRYFSGEEQAALERQLTPETRAWRHQRVEL